MSDMVLIADDEPDIRDVAKLILEKRGYQVITANNGEEALNKANIEKPDTLLLDLVMPGKSGLEVCKTLKSNPKTNSIPIVIFTVLGRDVDRKLTQQAGADSHLIKPFSPKELHLEIKKQIEAYQKKKFSSSSELTTQSCEVKKYSSNLILQPLMRD
jgi:DNA-binding response OmpR family regulator